METIKKTKCYFLDSNSISLSVYNIIIIQVLFNFKFLPLKLVCGGGASKNKLNYKKTKKQKAGKVVQKSNQGSLKENE